MNRVIILCVVLASCALAADPAKIDPYLRPSADEPKLAELSLAKAAESLDRISLAWVRKHECGSCHTGWPYLMARGAPGEAPTPALE